MVLPQVGCNPTVPALMRSPNLLRRKPGGLSNAPSPKRGARSLRRWVCVLRLITPVRATTLAMYRMWWRLRIRRIWFLGGGLVGILACPRTSSE